MFKKSKLLVLAAAIVAPLVLTGCLGDSSKKESTFACVKTIHKYNTGEISQNKWVNEILFIIPGGICYGIGGFLDVIIFNSLQFWTGENPLLASTVTDANGTDYLLAKQENGNVKATNTKTGETIELCYDASKKTCIVKEG